MWNESEANDQARERISALLDGELERGAVPQACAHWRESAESRATWHAYHLIGDVLRSDDLACHPARDASFLANLRARLAEEPVVLAPQALTAPPVDAASSPQLVRTVAPRRRSWLAPAAAAAGFVAVAGVLTLTRPGFLPDRSSAPDQLAQAGAGTAAAVPAALGPVGQVRPASVTVPATAEPQTFVANGQLIRDARLDRYLSAHQQFAGSSALGVPSAYLRNATAEMPGR
jgi:sigma-E factor negative regulatory protein RseA